MPRSSPRRLIVTAALTVTLALGACKKAEQPPGPAPDPASDAASLPTPPAAPAADKPAIPLAPTTYLEPPAPGQPGGLPDDRRPISEEAPDPKGAQGAAQVVENYAALLEQGKYDLAYDLWSDAGKASGMTKQAFTASFAQYAEVHGLIGAPTDTEGAAGSIYTTVPLQLYGRLKSGGTFNMIGPVTLRRINDVPGATPAQLRWHISQSALKPAGIVKEVPVDR